MPNLVPPVPMGVPWEDSITFQWLEEVRNLVNNPVFFAQPTDPGATGVPNGRYGVWKNTTTGVIKLWVNDGGVLKSVTLT